MSIGNTLAVTVEEHLAEVDAMLARGELDADDHARARARAVAAVRRGEDLPPLPAVSRPSPDRRSLRRGRRQARVERHETGMSRTDQARRDAVDAARAARDAEVARLTTVNDRALAAGRVSEVEHAATRATLDRLAREFVPVAVTPTAGPSRLAAIAAVLDAFAD